MTKPVKKNLSGWGNYPVHNCYVYRPENIIDMKRILESKNNANYIPYGLGRSYGDTALNNNSGVILQNMLNRFISFDKQTGILECEAGVTFEEIIQHFLKKGYFLPVTPGTKFVTVGGAIANDVHGKNHHQDGCISEFILSFNMLTASGDMIECSREKNSELFWATIGGLGLTGIIISAQIKLIPVETSFIKANYQKSSNIDETLELFLQGDEEFQYSVAWIDCLSKGKSLGRSVLIRGNHALRSDLTNKTEHPLKIENKKKIIVPFNMPSFSLNHFSIHLFNNVYFHSHKYEAKIIDYDSFFYPLDSILHWNRMYGTKGFIQYQAVFPTEKSRNGLVALLEKLSQSKRPSFLAVLKSSGEQNKGLLSFPLKGHTLALDIPVKDQSLFDFIKELDKIVVHYGGRVYLAKDSSVSPDLFHTMYPSIEKFKKIKKEVDPDNLFSSSMARRLGIVEE